VYTKVVDIALGKHLVITTDTGQVYFAFFRVKSVNHSKQNDSVTQQTRSSNSKVEVVTSEKGLSLDQVFRFLMLLYTKVKTLN